MNCKPILLLAMIATFTGCIVIKRATVFVHFPTIDSSSNNLKLNFTFQELVSDKNSYVKEISILKNGVLLYKLESQSDRYISSWNFPAIPEGFKITYPENTENLGQFYKNEELKFEFQGPDYHVSFNGWIYQPQYATKDYRWLFDNAGNYKINVDCNYEPWLGKDIIKIVASSDFMVTENAFALTDATGNPIPFDIKYKRNPTNKIALILKKGFKKDEVIKVAFTSSEGNKFENKVVVPDKSVIGLVGKYSDL